jgi:malonyl-CoA O-methyltransferase
MLRCLRRLIYRDTIPILNSLDAYAQWAATYPPQAHNALMHTEQAIMGRLMPDLHGKSVLDLACGTGRYGLLAQKQGAACVIGLDNSSPMLAANPLKHLAVATVEAIPLHSRSVDVVLCGLALGHSSDLMPAMREISRVLKPDGLALISDFHPFISLNGGQRTFTSSDGTTYAVEHHPHLYADYHRATREAGLFIQDVIESGVKNAPSSMPAVIVYALARQR